MNLMSLKELCEYVGLSHVTVRKRIKEGAIPFKRIGNLYKFSKEEIDNWVKTGESAK